ncbi:MAG: hypothetical protein ACPGNT_02565 [Rhodospirillales bacterium]
MMLWRNLALRLLLFALLICGGSVDVRAQETIPMRIGQHFDYSRIVFDFERAIGVTVSKDGSIATLRFDRAVNLDIADLNSNPPDWVGGADQVTEGGETVLRLSVAPNARLNNFPSGTKLVLDVRAPEDMMEKAPPLPARVAARVAPRVAPRVAAAPEPTEQPAQQPTQQPAGQSRVEAPPPEPAPPPVTTPEAAPEPETAPAQPEVMSAEQPTPPATNPATPRLPEPSANQPPPPVAAPVESVTQAETAPRGLVPADNRGETTETVAQAPQQLAPQQLAPQQLAPQQLTPRQLTPQAEQAAPSATASPQPIIDGAVSAARDEGGVQLRFDWDEPVAAAGFRRAGAFWIVFDKPARLDTTAIQQSAGAAIPTVEQIASNQGTILRLTTLRGFNPTVSRDGLAWLFDFRQQGPGATTPIAIQAQPDSPQGARLFATVGEPGKPIAVNDPTVGDNLAVVPVIPLGHGVNDMRDYPELSVLQSTQGLVVAPKIDDLRLRSLRDGIEITATGTLAISPVNEEQLASSNLGSAAEFSRIFNLNGFRDLAQPGDVEARQALQASISGAAQGQARINAQLELARFFLSSGFESETLGVLAAVARENESFQDTAEFRGLRGVARLFMGRMGEAAEDLNHKSLDAADEGLFWRAALAYENDPREETGQTLRLMGAITREYPKALRLPSGLIVAQAAVRLGDIEMAEKFIEALRSDLPGPAGEAQIDMVEGQLREVTGEFDDAIAAYERAMATNDRFSRSRAARLRGELLYKLERSSRADLIRALERLRFAWRGDRFEFTLLRRMGELYLEEGDFRNGLRTLRQAATHFRDEPEAPEITEKMATTFDDLFMQGAADQLPPVTAIALYDEFKELTPAGAKGDEMIRKLADRLVGVDLLDRAAALLESQVNFRLTGELKARVGARLALVRLMDNLPEDALAALDASNTGAGDEELATQRRHLRAKALITVNRGEEALELLKPDKSPDAELLRLDVYWKKRDWPMAAQTLRLVLKNEGVDKRKPLDPHQADLVLNLAVAYTLAGNERGTQRLKDDFGLAMADTRMADAFRLIATPQDPTLIDFREVATKVMTAQNFQAFMEAYKQRLKDGGLSAIN